MTRQEGEARLMKNEETVADLKSRLQASHH
jgi:hypothetical protein